MPARAYELALARLPSHARDAGVSAFGSLRALESVLNETRVQRLTTLHGRLTLRLASWSSDSSVAHLRHAMRNDTYDVHYFEREHKTDGVVVDVGANLGYFSLVMAKLYPRMRIIGVEPSPPTYFFFVLNLHLNSVRVLSQSAFCAASSPPGVLPLHAALGTDASANRSSVTFRYPVRGDSQLAVVATAGADLLAGWREQRVRLTHLPSFLDGCGVRRLRVLKTDCEGCEWTLLPTLGEWLTPPVETPGIKMRFWRWPSLLHPYRPRIERLVGELHHGASLDAARPGKKVAASSRWRGPGAAHVFATVRVLVQRGCPLGAPGQVGLSPC